MSLQRDIVEMALAGIVTLRSSPTGNSGKDLREAEPVSAVNASGMEHFDSQRRTTFLRRWRAACISSSKEERVCCIMLWCSW